LSTTGLPPTAAGGSSALARMDAIESALRDLTAQTEALENRVNRIVADGTNRIDDLRFRLTELEGGDIASIGPTPPLGGEAPTRPAPAAPSPGGQGAGAQLAVAEQADFDRAREALEAGDYGAAEERFATFAQNFPAGPLTSKAHFYRGQALSAQGRTAAAARAYLDSFSGEPEGELAPDALLQLGRSLGDLGQEQDACVTLGEVGVRFPGSAAAEEAALIRQRYDCT
jgi:tol-pal system protein YbgF